MSGDATTRRTAGCLGPIRLGQSRDWRPILTRAVAIVDAIFAETGITLTLRKLFYKLVGEALIENTRSSYTYLSHVTGIGRKDGTFPDLAEDKVAIIMAPFWTSADDRIEAAARSHQRDRRHGQPFNVIIACEKAGTVPFLEMWYTDTRHIPIVPLGGETSITTWKKVRQFIADDARPPRVLDWSDYDKDGYAIRSRFQNNLDITDEEFIHVGLTREQVDAYRLPRAPGKERSAKSYADRFVAETGEDVQVELDALDEAVLRTVTDDAFAALWDEDAYQRVLAQEDRDRAELRARWARGARR